MNRYAFTASAGVAGYMNGQRGWELVGTMASPPPSPAASAVSPANRHHGGSVIFCLVWFDLEVSVPEELSREDLIASMRGALR